MKKLLAAALLFVSLATQAQTIAFINNDWNKARAEAKQKNKYLIVDAYTDWCSWCKVMDRETFPDKEVVEFVSKNFVALKLEMEHNYGINVAMKYHVTGFPSFLILTPEGKLVKKLSGYMPPQDFLGALKTALDPQQTPPLPGISTTVDLPFPSFYKKSFGAGGAKRVYPADTTVVNYLKNQKDLYSEVNYNVMVQFPKQLTTDLLMQLLKNKNKYEQLFGKGEIDNVVSTTASMMVNAGIQYKSKEDLNQALELVNKFQSEYKEETKENLQITFFLGLKDWYQFAKIVDQHIAKNGSTSPRINDWSWRVYEQCGDIETVNKAIGWMKAVVEQKPEYASTDTYAALLYKAKQYAEAKTYALKAIELGKAAGEKTNETEELLKKIEAAQ
ncbi:MAG: hypothetical protein RLZZ367_1773 [Bacteroidota bacterium]|jgi:thioredoxin-related protein